MTNSTNYSKNVSLVIASHLRNAWCCAGGYDEAADIRKIVFLRIASIAFTCDFDGRDSL